MFRKVWFYGVAICVSFLALFALPRDVFSQTLLVNGAASTSAGAGETLTIQLTGGPAHQADWLGLYVSGSSNSEWLDWRYVNGTRQMPTSGLSNATVTTALPTGIGSYQVRLFSGATGSVIASSGAITVTAGVQGATIAFGVPSLMAVDPSSAGNGNDGALTLTTPFNCQTMVRAGKPGPDCVATALKASAAAGQSAISVETTAGFAAGDEVLVAQMTASGATTSEFGTIASATSGQLTLSGALVNGYSVPTRTSVTWANLVGASASGITLSNTGCTADWGCGAVSTQTIASGDGFVEFTVSHLTSKSMAGLAIGNTSASFTDIEFALYLNAGTLQIYESGVSRGSVGTYAVNDRLRVAVEQGAVTYRQNGRLLYRSRVAPSYPLLLDSSFYSTGAAIIDAVIASGSGSAQVVRVPNYSNALLAGSGVSNVGWSYVSPGVAVTGNTIRGGSCPNWTCGAVSDFALHGGDGWVEFSVSEIDVYKMGGLGDAGPMVGTTSVAYGVMLSPGGGVYVFERGVMVGSGAFGSFAAGDTFRVGIENGQVVYRRNGASFHTSTVAPAYPLRFVGELYSDGAVISNVKLSTAGSITGTAWDDHLGGAMVLRSRDTFIVSPTSAVHLVAGVWRGLLPSFITVNGSSGPVTVSSGATISANVSGGISRASDQLKLFTVGGTQPLSWWYLNGTQTAPAGAITNATLNVALPSGAGSFELRLSGTHRSATSAPIAGVPTVIVNGMPPSSSVITEPGAVLTAQIAGGTGQPGDRVELHLAGGTGWLEWKHLNDTQTPPPSGTSSGTVVFTAPSSLGGYVIQFYSSGGTLLASSAPIMVVGAGQAGLTLQFGGGLPISENEVGSGSDGALDISAPFNCQRMTRAGRAAPDCIAVPIAAPVSAGATTIAVRSSLGFVAGDEIIVAQMTGPAAGTRETRTLASVASTQLTLATPLTNGYQVPSPVAVTWTSAVAASASGSTLANTGCTTEWTCGAISTQSIASGDGYVEFSASPTAGAIGGLGGVDTNQSYTDLEFALYAAYGTLYVYESGWQRGPVGPYNASDRLRVGVEMGVVTYRKNGLLLYRSTIAPTYPLIFDSSLQATAGAVIANAVIASGAETAQLVRIPNYTTVSIGGQGLSNVGWWYQSKGVTVATNTLKSGSCTGWTCGAVSDFSLRAPGYVEFSSNEIDYYKLGGLGDATLTAGTASVAYGVMLSPGGGVYVFERGVMRGGGTLGSFAAGDTFRIGIEGGQVVYRQNGTVFYVSSVAPAYPLHFVGEVYEPGAQITNARLFAAGTVTGNTWDGATGGIFSLRVRDTIALGQESSVHFGSTIWQGQVCAYGATPQQVIGLGASGASGAITISTPPGCTWTGVSNTSWITTAGSSGRGSGTFSYTVAANTATAGRAGSLSVTGQAQPISITQQGTCSYSMTPAVGAAFPITGGSGSYNVTTGTSACGWSATSNATWLTVTNGTGRTGSGLFDYVVAANPDPIPRSATVTMNHLIVPITQAANCQFTVDPGSTATAPTLGVTRTATISANGSGCGWTIGADVAWITISGATTGTGSGTRSYTIAPNMAAATRVGHLLVAGQSITVTQAGVPRELITNGTFDQGFAAADPQYGTGVVANGWTNFANSNFSTELSQAGVTLDPEQRITHGGETDGIVQWLSVPPGVPYVLTADVFVEAGAAKLYIHAAGALDPNAVTTMRQGATRLRLPFTQNHHLYGVDNTLVGVFAVGPDSTIRVDNVRLRTVADEAADESIVNGRFTAGFYAFGDASGSGWLGNYWTHLGQSTPPQGVFSVIGPPWDLGQHVDGGGVGTGLQQIVVLQANQQYMLHANVKMDSGGVKLVIGPTGGVEQQQVYLCTGQNPWHELQTLFTPSFTGSYTVALKSLFAGSSYSVDDISVVPSNANFVQASTGGTGTPCIQMHEVIFEVHDSVTQNPVPNAVVAITPSYGSGPPRTTNSQGLVTYQVGAGQLAFTITANGYPLHAGTVNVSGSQTHAVALGNSSSSRTDGVRITQPLPNSSFGAGATVAVQATADSSGDAITRVEFFVDDFFVSSDSTPPYVANLSGLSVGTHHLTARSYAGALLVHVSTPVSIYVIADSCDNVPAPNPHDTFPDDDGLNCLIAAGGIITLSYGYPGYIIATGLQISSDVTVTLQGDPTEDSKTRLVADPWLDAPMLLATSNARNFRLEKLIFDGNREARMLMNSSCRSGEDRSRGYNLKILGSHFTISNIHSSKALCGSALEVTSNNFEISNSQFLDNGFQDSENPGGLETWSDGITLGACIDGTVRNNTFYNNTDVDLIVGPGSGCVVHDNQIFHTTRYAYAGLMVGFSGDHSGSIVRNNTVESAPNLISIGLMVGQHPWNTSWTNPPAPPTPSMLSNTGHVIDNTISGAVTLLWIEGIEAGTVVGNTLYNRQGTKGLFGCQSRPAYAAYDFGSATIQGVGLPEGSGGPASIRFEDGVCVPQ